MRFDKQLGREVPEDGVDYELVPGENDAWAIRFKTGPYVETVFGFGQLRVSGEGEEPVMSFDFDIIETPDADLSAKDIDLQLAVGDVLSDILVRSIEEETVVTRESE
jgi:hypothetical protein